jgi:hypothetical protein
MFQRSAYVDEGYFITAVGLDEEGIRKKYIKNEEEDDRK